MKDLCINKGEKVKIKFLDTVKDYDIHKIVKKHSDKCSLCNSGNIPKGINIIYEKVGNKYVTLQEGSNDK